MNFKPGQTAHFTATFKVGTVLTDPGSVTFKLKCISTGVEYSHTFPGTGLAHPSTGVYTFDYPVTTADVVGSWLVRAIGTGACADAVETQFQIVASQFSA